MSLDYDRGGTPLNRPYVPQPGPYQPMLPNSPLLPQLAYPAPIMLPGDPGYGAAPATGYAPAPTPAPRPGPVAAAPPAAASFPGVDFSQGPVAKAPPRTAVQAQDETVEPYESMVQQYLASLQSPTQLPAPPGLSHAQAIAVVMNPDKSRELMAYFDEPYRHQVRSYELNEQRRLRGAEGMLRLADRREARRDRLSDQRYMRDQVNANAGNVGWDYSANPELATLAASRRGDFSTLHKDQSTQVADQRRKDRLAETRRIEDDSRQAESQLAYLHQALTQAPGAEAEITAIIQRTRARVEDLNSYRELMNRFTDEEFDLFQRLTADERAEYIRVIRQKSTTPQARQSAQFSP